MSYQPILQVTARNYASTIMVGAPTNATFKPMNGINACTFVYPQRNRPKVGIVYAPGADGEVYFASRSYNWVGVKIGNQYGWVNLDDMLIDPFIPLVAPEIEALAEPVVDSATEGASVEIEAVSGAGNDTVEEPVPPKRKYNKSTK